MALASLPIALSRLIVLGSQSASRYSILKDMGCLNVMKISPNIDEYSIGDRSCSKYASDLVLALGKAKASAILEKLDSSITEGVIITGDQVITYKDAILEKPNNVAEAKQFISGYSNSSCSTVGSVVLTDIATRVQKYAVSVCTIHFSNIPAEALPTIVENADSEIMYCCGALMIEHPVLSRYIRRIEGPEDSVRGLNSSDVMVLARELDAELMES